jgi:hypothetical protein
MGDELTCGVRIVPSPDGTDIPVPTGGLGLASGPVILREDAAVQISGSADQGYYVVVNNSAEGSNEEAGELFGELATETAITKLEHMATEAFTSAAPVVFKLAGLAAGVLVSLFTSSKLTREVFIRTSLEMSEPVDGPPVTYCLLI